MTCLAGEQLNVLLTLSPSFQFGRSNEDVMLISLKGELESSRAPAISLMHEGSVFLLYVQIRGKQNLPEAMHPTL